MYQVKNCPCCWSNTFQLRPAVISAFTMYRITDAKSAEPMPAQLVDCGCGYAGSEQRFDSIEIDRLYNGYRGFDYNQQRVRFDPGYSSRSEYEPDSEYKRRRHQNIMKLLNDYDYKSLKKILDWGGDDGSLIPDEFKHCDRAIYEVRPVTTVPGVRQISCLINETFDLVLNCHVLEHVSEPGECLIDLKKYMHKDSFVYVEVPGYSQRPPNNVVITEHINFFTLDSLSLLMKNMGYIILEARYDNEIFLLGKPI